MARGWESKSIEAQQEEATRAAASGPAPSPEEQARDERRRTIELMRKRALDDLSRATAPPHRHMLEHAIAALDEQLARLKSAGEPASGKTGERENRRVKTTGEPANGRTAE
jgi:hypothetical protein